YLVGQLSDSESPPEGAQPVAPSAESESGAAAQSGD
ncbi:MAG: hypothetical protein QOI28_164, partial [Mycobacterium sp.]|nr:hypothetical protein [Mycobacterium sp.]